MLTIYFSEFIYTLRSAILGTKVMDRQAIDIIYVADVRSYKESLSLHDLFLCYSRPPAPRGPPQPSLRVQRVSTRSGPTGSVMAAPAVTSL